MRRSFKYRLYPTPNQVRELTTMLETHRRLYNAALAERKTVWESEQRTVSYVDQARGFTVQRPDNAWYQRINVSSAQATLRRLDRAFQAFFRRVRTGETPGYPRFKARGRFDSWTYPTHGDGSRLRDQRLRLQFIGDVRVRLHRPIEGEIKTVTVLQDADDWYVVFSCDLSALPQPAPKHGPAIGVDLGLEAFLTTSEGERVENPRFLEHALPALRRTQRSVSRKRKGGKNRKKAVRKLRRQHQRVRNQRREFHRRVARQLIDASGAIAMERLTVCNMVRNRRFARRIADVAWGDFGLTVTHLAERAGVAVYFVDPRGTSQACSSCGTDVPKPLGERWHACPACGFAAHRDVNAARNVLLRATGADGTSGTSSRALA